jgi:hypothetical protein
MKIRQTLSALALGLAFAAGAHSASAQEAPRLLLNDRPLRTRVEPVLEDGRVLVPLRDIFEALGARVDYDREDRTITARRAGSLVHMALGSQSAVADGHIVHLDVPADTIAGRTLVPLRFVSESLGATVFYSHLRDEVHINADARSPTRNPARARHDDLARREDHDSSDR